MEIQPLDRSVQASDLPLERLANSDQVSKQEKIGEAARQFEAVLLRQILSQAQKPLFNNTLFPGGGTANAIYQDMVTQQLADRISEGGTFGFASVLKRELTAEYGDKKADMDKNVDGGRKADTNTRADMDKTAAASTHSAEQKINKYKSPAIQPGKRI
jgi:Rod binding domain-containing protein